MKKVVLTAVASLLMLSFGMALAQSAQSHQVNVNIPGVVMIRMTNGAGNGAVTNPGGVTFDAIADANGDFAGTLTPSLSGTPWTDIRVFANVTGDWRVSVTTSNGDFDWSKISNSVETPSAELSFNLPVNDTAELFAAAGRTNGWRSLAINPNNYRLALDGLENDGNFSTTVTYSIAQF